MIDKIKGLCVQMIYLHKSILFLVSISCEMFVINTFRAHSKYYILNMKCFK